MTGVTVDAASDITAADAVSSLLGMALAGLLVGLVARLARWN